MGKRSYGVDDRNDKGYNVDDNANDHVNVVTMLKSMHMVKSSQC